MAKSKISSKDTNHKNEVAERQTDMGNKKQTTNITAKSHTSRKARMLSNPEIKRWHDNLARGSPITAEVRMRRLDKFCQMHDMTPMELADLGMKDVRTVTNLLEDHITAMEEDSKSPGYIEDHIKSAKS